MPFVLTLSMLLLTCVIGVGIGVVAARRIGAAMPRLTHGLHSLVGLTVMLVAVAAYRNPIAFGVGDMVVPMIGQPFVVIDPTVKVVMGLVGAIGAITFAGSVMMVVKLAGAGKPTLLPGRHAISMTAGTVILLLIATFAYEQADWPFWAILVLSIATGVLLTVPIGGANIAMTGSMLNSGSGWAAAVLGLTLGNMVMIVAGALIGSSSATSAFMLARQRAAAAAT